MKFYTLTAVFGITLFQFDGVVQLQAVAHTHWSKYIWSGISWEPLRAAHVPDGDLNSITPFDPVHVHNSFLFLPTNS